MYVVEKLEMNSEQLQFSCRANEAEDETIEQALGSFFSTYECGIHVALICMEPEENIEKWLNDHSAVEKKDGKGKVKVRSSELPVGEREYTYICATMGRTAGNGIAAGALMGIADVCKDDLSTECIGLIGYMKMQSVNGALEQDVFTYKNAEDLSRLLMPNMLQGGAVPERRILVFLPLDHYETFKKEECYFPKQLEYVVKVETFSQLKRDLKESREKEELLEKKCLEKDIKIIRLEEENKQIRRGNILQLEMLHQSVDEIFIECIKMEKEGISSKDKEKETNVRGLLTRMTGEKTSQSKENIEKDEERHDYGQVNMPMAEERDGQHYKHGERGMEGNPHEEKEPSYDQGSYRQEDDVR